MIALQHILDAINVGGLYALMALGIGLIFGIMRLINFAHGEMVMAGGYAMTMMVMLPTPLVIVLSIAFVIVMALMIERGAFRPLRGKDPATLLVASFAVSYFLQNLAIMIFGTRPIPFTFLPGLAEIYEVAGLRVPLLQFVSLGLTVLALGGLALLLKRTAIGIELRAAAEDVVTAQLSGIRVNRVIAMAFALSAVLAWVVSLIYSAQIGQLSPTMGVRPLIIGFVATILGGLGSLPGAALGGFVVGVVSVLLEVVLPPETRPFREAFLFGLVFIILVVRPEGLVRVRALQERV
ncbi:MAG: branched-chain amino acid ABC transporter permease [Rhizobiaceae bacterium]